MIRTPRCAVFTATEAGTLVRGSQGIHAQPLWRQLPCTLSSGGAAASGGGATEGLSAYETCEDTCNGCKYRKQDLNEGLIHLMEEGHPNGRNERNSGTPQDPLKGVDDF